MSIPYDAVVGAFLSKITEFDMINMDDDYREETVDGYMKRAVSEFDRVCKQDLTTSFDSATRMFNVDVSDAAADEIINILSEGMVVQWLKPYVYQQELLQNVLSTRDFTQYSPAELLMRVGNAYRRAQKDYTQMIREYSYNHGDLTVLHI
jgi:hypothetical protein